MPQDVCPIVSAHYKQWANETSQTAKAAIIAPLYLCMIAGTGGVYTLSSLPLVWANQPNQIVQIRGHHPKRSHILSSSQHLIQIREMFGLTMTELAQVLGVSRPTAYSWINGIEPKESEAKALISKLSRHVETLRSSGIATVDVLARHPLTSGKSLIDLLKSGKDVSTEIASVRFTASQTVGQSKIKRNFGPTLKERRVRTDELSAPIVIGPGDEA